jgi:arylsulfatase A-like enzyme
MTPRSDTFHQALFRLWFLLTAIFSAALLLALALLLFPKVSGWSYYLTCSEAAYEVAVRAAFLTFVGAILGSLWTIVAAPFLLPVASRSGAARATVRAASGIALFLDLFVALATLADWAYLSKTQQLALFAGFAAAFAASLGNPRLRRALTTRFDGMLASRATRPAMFAMGVAAAALAVAGRAQLTSARAPLGAEHPHPNILLITFDALSADDMSLYGYRLPTTPRLAEFAAKSSVFTNFYSASTFTTPSIACLLTGLSPSESGVYHLPGRLRGPRGAQTFPRLLRQSGYVTAATIASPMAYFLASWQSADFDFLDGPVYRTGGFLRLWDAIARLRPPVSFGSRLDEFRDLEKTWRFVPALLNGYDSKLFTHSRSAYPPAEIFDRARSLMHSLPPGFFLWVHVLAPHYPYLPDAHLGSFLPGPAMRTAEQQVAFSRGATYTPDQQPNVDKDRLRYDEFLADADSAFGSFIGQLETDGKLRDTAVLITSDHGESFQGGVFQHETRFQVLPEIHIPLIVHMPGQERPSRVSFAADQTALAPTILEIAGLPRAVWMRGPSLVPRLNPDAPNRAENAGRGLAFTEYLETDSIFRPPDSGSAGVTDGVHQYVLHLGAGEGELRNLAEPLLWNIDRSNEDPGAARDLRAALLARFPNLLRK